MMYKGYEGLAEFDEDAHIFSGEVLGLKDVITFQGESVSELEPEKPYSGKMLLRFDPNLHRRVAAAAKKKKMSVNKFMEKAAEDELMQG